MKVKKIIEILQDMPQDYEVRLYDSRGEKYYSDINDVGIDTVITNGKEHRIVVIDHIEPLP